MALKLEIPVGVAFEKRLAELIWENCPELARQTAAGRMALAIDVSDSGTIKEATKKTIEEASSQLVKPLLDAAQKLLEESSSVDRVVSDVKETIKATRETIEGTLKKRAANALEKAVQEYLDRVFVQQVRDVASGMFNDRPLARTVREMMERVIRDYLAHQLEPHKTGHGVLRAASEEAIARVAQELGKG
jgi:uncharacterized membrane-anchored protein YjiN (DUF445 family)